MKGAFGFALGGLVFGLFALIPFLMVMAYATGNEEHLLKNYEINLRNYAQGMADGAVRATNRCPK